MLACSNAGCVDSQFSSRTVSTGPKLVAGQDSHRSGDRVEDSAARSAGQLSIKWCDGDSASPDQLQPGPETEHVIISISPSLNILPV